MKQKNKKPNSYGTARYIAEEYGDDLPDEIIFELAKSLNMYPKVLIKNYKSVTKINKALKKFLNEKHI